MTTFEAMLRVSGLDEEAAAHFFGVRPRAVRRWIGGGAPRPEALEMLADLFERQRECAARAAAAWVHAGRPEAFSIRVAASDEEARREGWPSRQAQLTAAALAQLEAPEAVVSVMSDTPLELCEEDLAEEEIAEGAVPPAPAPAEVDEPEQEVPSWVASLAAEPRVAEPAERPAGTKPAARADDEGEPQTGDAASEKAEDAAAIVAEANEEAVVRSLALAGKLRAKVRRIPAEEAPEGPKAEPPTQAPLVATGILRAATAAQPDEEPSPLATRAAS